MANLLERVRNARTTLKTNGSFDIQQMEALEHLFNETQEIVEQMNKAKIEALRKAEEPFQQKLEELDKEFSTLIVLMG